MTSTRRGVWEALHRTLEHDAAQLAVLELVAQNRRGLVEGTAGSGKTVVARELALRRAMQGGRVLFTCFTDAVAVHVDASLAAARAAGLDARSRALRRLAFEVAGASPRHDGETAAILERARITVAGGVLGRFDLVVVDEAQDLDAADWELVAALAEGADLWVFTDPTQRFWPERRIPAWVEASATRLRLPAQHRLPPGLVAFAALYAAPPTAGTRGAAPAAGADVVTLHRTSAAGTRAAVADTLAQIFRAGVDPAHVAVLSLAGRERSRLAGLEHLAGIPTRSADAEDAAGHLIVDTVLRFKGLERPIILLAELAATGTAHRHDVRMHIGLTRATAHVHVLATPAALAADPRLGGRGAG